MKTTLTMVGTTGIKITVDQDCLANVIQRILHGDSEQKETFSVKNNVEHFWNLSSPKMCRDFLKKAFIKNKETGEIMDFTKIVNEFGEEYSIDDAPDEAVLQVAQEIATFMQRIQQ